MSYRDLPAALERIERLEAALRERDDDEPAPRSFPFLDAYVFASLVIAGAAVILVTSWLVNAT